MNSKNRYTNTLLNDLIKQQDQQRDAVKLLVRRYRTVKGSVEMLTVFKNPSFKSAACMVEDAELLLDAAKRLHSAMAEIEDRSGFQINPPRRDSLAEIIKQQNLERGLEPLPLEP
jgi:hypothetical protein